MDYLESVQIKKILTGISGCLDAQVQAVLYITGREPAISAHDVAGFHRKWEKTFNHEHLLTLDRLPLLTEGNVVPNVRITEPADGLEVRGPDVALAGFANDRNANLKSVTLHALGEPWRNWFLRADSDVFRFEPVQARYVRLHGTERAVTWQADTVFELGVYEAIPP